MIQTVTNGILLGIQLLFIVLGTLVGVIIILLIGYWLLNLRGAWLGDFIKTLKLRRYLQSDAPLNDKTPIKQVHRANRLARQSSIVSNQNGHVLLYVPKKLRWQLSDTKGSVIKELKQRLKDDDLRDWLTDHYPNTTFSDVISYKNHFEIIGDENEFL